MKIAYLLPINIEKYGGVLNKVDSQVSAWIEAGMEVRIILITSNRNTPIETTALGSLYQRGVVEVHYTREKGLLPVDLLKDLAGLKSSFSKVLERLHDYNPDLVYTRSTQYQPFYKRVGVKYKLVLEINTDMSSEYKIQALQSFRYFFRYLYFILTNHLLLKKVAGIAAVTFEIEEKYKDMKSGVFPNSINVGGYRECKKGTTEQRILFIGSPGMPWHGVDILVELATKMPEVYFDIIGISASEFASTVPDNVHFYGYLNKSEYLPLFEKARATVASLAFFRNGMNEACPLKVREYLACCKPVILPYKDTAFEQKGYPDWVLKLENDKEKILSSTGEIRSFLEKCDEFNLTQQQVMRYVDVEYIEKERVSFFREIIKKNV
ncbi:glycosyltransferase [Sinomicrobium sp.]